MQNTVLKYKEYSDSLFKAENFKEKKIFFNNIIESIYNDQLRTFDWRELISDYRVFISEVMLQQTQTSRVAEKFPLFLTKFPDFKSLANASLHQVIEVWSGLGYNRRARFLHEAAKIIVSQHNASLPLSTEELDALPGIGINTAGSILAFARNQPTLFLETNIKAVLIFYFFPDQEKIHDRELLAILPELLDTTDPRKWYYAMMDHGVELKKKYINPTRKSSSYTKQSPFDGSIRQVRGAILRFLIENNQTTKSLFLEKSKYQEKLFDLASKQLITEKLISFDGLYFKIS